MPCSSCTLLAASSRLCPCRAQAAHLAPVSWAPIPSCWWLATAVCQGDRGCGSVLEQLLPRGLWGPVYQVPALAVGIPARTTCVRCLGSLHSSGAALGVASLGHGPSVPAGVSFFSSVQVLFLDSARAREGARYDSSFAFLPPPPRVHSAAASSSLCRKTFPAWWRGGHPRLP